MENEVFIDPTDYFATIRCRLSKRKEKTMRYKRTSKQVDWRSVLEKMVKGDDVFWGDGLFWRIDKYGYLEFSNGSKYDEWEQSTRNFRECADIEWYDTEESSDL